MRIIPIGLLLTALFASPGLADINQDATSAITSMMETLERDDALRLDGEQILAVRAMIPLYAGSGDAPIWTNSATVQHLLEAIDAMADDGLEPAEYHRAALVSVGTAMPDDPDTLARRDVLLSDAYFTMLYSLVFGKADPHRLDQDWNLDALYDEMDLTEEKTREQVAADIRATVVDGDLDRLFARARPNLPLYLNLRAGYKFYRDLASAGGWPAVPEGATLREGDTDPRVNVIRQRLILTEDFVGHDTGSSVYDADLATAAARFQGRHGLTADGVVGKRTIASMNVPAAERADQIRINLERARWVMRYELGGNLVLVNIASYEAALIRDHEPIWKTRVQVGTPYTRTPIFTESIRYIVFNPTWTVPASIANKSTLQNLKKNPDYLSTENMVLLDSDGNKVDPMTVDWNSLSRMPYTVRQEPGPHNSLGRVKFIFPNKHAVYLHDTPSRQHFSRSDRAFSHGCIRTENPLELAALLLDDQPKWTPEYIDTVIESEKQTRVNLTEPLPVLLLYWTAYALETGAISFRDDLYDRDASVLKALNSSLRPRRRHEQ